MSDKYQLSVGILAAGKSSRMGQPKQLLSWGESTLLVSVVEIAQQLDVFDVKVILGAHYTAIKKSLPADTQVVCNGDYELGILSSIKSAFSSVREQSTHLLVLLGDQPGVENIYLDKMIAQSKANPQKIICSSYGANAGVPIIFPVGLAKKIAALPACDTGIKHLIKKLGLQVIQLNSNLKLYDIDTMEDYVRYRKPAQE